MVDTKAKNSGQILFLVDKNHFLLKFVDVATKINISGKIHFFTSTKQLKYGR